MDMMTPPEGFVIESLEMGKQLTGGEILIQFRPTSKDWEWWITRQITDRRLEVMSEGIEPTLSQAVAAAHAAAVKHGFTDAFS